jgi:hypothetical protein
MPISAAIDQKVREEVQIALRLASKLLGERQRAVAAAMEHPRYCHDCRNSNLYCDDFINQLKELARDPVVPFHQRFRRWVRRGLPARHIDNPLTPLPRIKTWKG